MAEHLIDRTIDLQDMFKEYGDIGDVYIPRSRNFGFVRFHNKSDAEASLETDGKELNGNTIAVQV